MSTTSEQVKAKILHLFEIYPKISPSMLQAGLGFSSIQPVIWRPILQQLILDNVIKLEEVTKTSPSGQFRTYKVLQRVTTNGS